MKKDLDIIDAYAPQSKRAKEDKAKFYEKLTQLIKKAPKRNNLLMAGDMNAKIINTTNEIEKNIAGPNYFNPPIVLDKMAEDTKNNRQRLFNFCANTGMKLVSINAECREV